MAASALCDEAFPPSSIDGLPWALQSWDARRTRWRWEATGLVPLRRTTRDLRVAADENDIRGPVRYVWVRHWTPDRIGRERGWRACIDVTKTIGPVGPEEKYGR